MKLSRSTAVVAFVLLAAVPLLRGQAAPDPSGHWEGVLAVPNMPIDFAVDFSKNSSGQLLGALTIPTQQIKGLPVTGISVDGTAIGFQLGKEAGNRAYAGVLSADGSAMSGEYTQDGYVIPFTLTRKGEARIAAAPKSAAIGKELEGTWNGSVSVDGKTMRLVLILANEPGGYSTGTLANIDQGALEVPIAAITHKAASVTLDVTAVGGTYVAALNAGGTELAGTWTQGRLVAPATFTRATASDSRK